MSYHTSYWGGHPSSSNNILDELAIYVDNDKDGNYDTKTDKVWDELWVSYADKKLKRSYQRKLQERPAMNYVLIMRLEKDQV